MTSKRQRQSGWLLPSPVTGYDLMLVCLCIPDVREYRAAFRGAVWELTKPWNWQALSPSDYSDQQVAATYWEQTLMEGLNMPCNICELMAGCINTILTTPYDDLSDGTKALADALTQWLESPEVSEIIGGGSRGVTQLPDAVSGDVYTGPCNPDYEWGFWGQFVDLADLCIQDVMEVLEVALNVSEAMGLVPEFGVFPSIVDFLVDSAAENYLSAITVGLKQEYACDLFCMANDNNCELSWSQVAEYFANRLSYNLSGHSLGDVLQYVVIGTWSGSEFADIGYLLFTSVLAYGGTWVGWTLSAMLNYIAAYNNDPSSDWSVLCDCGWSHEFDFTVGQQGWEYEVTDNEDELPLARYVAGQGWSNYIVTPADGDYYPDVNGGVRIKHALLPTPTFHVTSVKFDVTLEDGCTVYYRVNPSGGMIELTTIDNAQTYKYRAWQKDVNQQYMRFDFLSDTDATDNTIVNKITLYGSGVDPWE